MWVLVYHRYYRQLYFAITHRKARSSSWNNLKFIYILPFKQDWPTSLSMQRKPAISRSFLRVTANIFLKRLQRRIAEKTITPDTTALYFCEADNGLSKLTTLDLDLFGRSRIGPKDFFGDQFGEMAAMTKAAIERKKEIRA